MLRSRVLQPLPHRCQACRCCRRQGLQWIYSFPFPCPQDSEPNDRQSCYKYNFVLGWAAEGHGSDPPAGHHFQILYEINYKGRYRLSFSKTFTSCRLITNSHLTPTGGPALPVPPPW
ncbi:hypothetical protein O3P69_015295 [Scylla paramamosain]|uniref:Uncharacterized protein n=1 Tax=Scylla paramamosain TaxID=85552 RepID=A0AAW0T3M5_SCYPA